MTTVQIIEAAREKLPYTSEFAHEVIRVPVRVSYPTENETGSMQLVAPVVFDKSFYEVEFRKQYIKNISIGWELVAVY